MKHDMNQLRMMKVAELKTLLKGMGVSGYSKLLKDDLIKLVKKTEKNKTAAAATKSSVGYSKLLKDDLIKLVQKMEKKKTVAAAKKTGGGGGAGCSKKRKADCIASDRCSWLVGKGCKAKASSASGKTVKKAKKVTAKKGKKENFKRLHPDRIPVRDLKNFKKNLDQADPKFVQMYNDVLPYQFYPTKINPEDPEELKDYDLTITDAPAGKSWTLINNSLIYTYAGAGEQSSFIKTNTKPFSVICFDYYDCDKSLLFAMLQSPGCTKKIFNTWVAMLLPAREVGISFPKESGRDIEEAVVFAVNFFKNSFPTQFATRKNIVGVYSHDYLYMPSSLGGGDKLFK